MQSETFSVNNTWSSFVIFVLKDPHLLESWEWRKYWTTNPDWVKSFWWGSNFNFNWWWGKICNFFGKSLSNIWVHSWTTWHNNVSIKFSSKIDVTFHNRLICNFMETFIFSLEEHRLEEGFRASELLVTNSDNLTIRKFILNFTSRWFLEFLEFSFIINSNISMFLFNILHNFSFCCCCECVTRFHKNFH